MNPFGRLGEQLREPLERRLVQTKMPTPESLCLERTSRLVLWCIVVGIPRIYCASVNGTSSLSVISDQVVRQAFVVMVNEHYVNASVKQFD